MMRTGHISKHVQTLGKLLPICFLNFGIFRVRFVAKCPNCEGLLKLRAK